MTLYEISDTWQEVLDAIEDGTIPEEAIGDTLEAVEGEFRDKADNLACYIKSLSIDARAIKDEAKQLAERARAKETKAKRLEDYLFDCMKYLELTKVESSRNKIQIMKKAPSLTINDEFIKWAEKTDVSFLTYANPVPNKTNIKQALKDGKDIPYVMFEGFERLSIK